MTATLAPDVPADFWCEPSVQAALTSQHMGRVVRAYRHHPHHGRRPLCQDRVASWVGLTQGQLSRVECGPPIVHMDKLVQWACVLKIPPRHLWFAHPDDAPVVGRRPVLAFAGATVVGAAIPAGHRELSFTDGQATLRAFAWELWRAGRQTLHPSEFPAALAARLGQFRAQLLGPDGALVVDSDGALGFALPSMVDLYVAQRIFAEIAEGDDRLFATAQTTHATDLAIKRYASESPLALVHLGRWMTRGESPVLRVNAGGVLAKVGDVRIADKVISNLRADVDARQLYLTAVLARVAALPWDEAGSWALKLNSALTQFGADHRAHLARAFATEVTNPNDAAARWFATIVLAAVDPSSSALSAALAAESCTENLRALAAVLSGQDPLTI